MNDEADSATSDDARDVLLSAARNEGIVAEYPQMADLCTPAILQQVVDLAWRCQFDDDRTVFKREIRELQEYVTQRARDADGAT